MTYVQSLDTTQGLARLLAGSGQSSRRNEWAMDVDRIDTQGSTSNSVASTSKIDKSNSQCHNCGRLGHWANECHSPKKGGFKGKSNPSSNFRNKKGRRGRNKGKGRRIRATDLDDEENSDNDDDETADEEDKAAQELSVI